MYYSFARACFLGGLDWTKNVKIVDQIQNIPHGGDGSRPPASKTAVHFFQPLTYRMSESDIETLLKQHNDGLGIGELQYIPRSSTW